MIKVVLVDENDKEIGLKEKYQAHKNPVPLHRAISVLVFNKKGELLLQRRSQSKKTWPGYWTNTICSHPYRGETYKAAAERRLKEEMGFTVSLNEIGKIIYSAVYNEVWGENEYDVVFRGEYSGEIKINPKEAADYKWISLNSLKNDIEKNPGIYTPWFKIILPKLTDWSKIPSK